MDGFVKNQEPAMVIGQFDEFGSPSVDGIAFRQDDPGLGYFEFAQIRIGIIRWLGIQLSQRNRRNYNKQGKQKKIQKVVSCELLAAAKHYGVAG